MDELIFRFLIGGTLVSAFALVGDAVHPKSFAGLFGAAPSIALAILGLTVATEGRDYAAIEARSMIAGAIAFFIYALIVSKVMMRYKPPALVATSALMLVWLATAFGLWFVWVGTTMDGQGRLLASQVPGSTNPQRSGQDRER
jgi:hypothetical protein